MSAGSIGRIFTRGATVLLTAGTALGGCSRSGWVPDSSPTCYSGPIDLTVRYVDGTPGANAAVGIFSMLWLPDPATGEPMRYPRTHRADAAGRFRMSDVRECMTPTWFYAADEHNGLAALLPINTFDQIGKPATLTLRKACWLTGGIKNPPEPSKLGIHDYGHIVFLSPGEKPSSRYLKQGCGDARFRYLVPPGTYLIRLGRATAIMKDIRIDVPAGRTEFDVGALEFEVASDVDGD